MRFRPCIDIHNGKVVQIVGSTLDDTKDTADSNFSSQKDSAYYAGLYKKHNLYGGHVIILNAASSKYFEKSRQEAINALKAYEGRMQLGGGVTDENAKEYIEKGASHVIVTSYIFKDGIINYDNLNRLIKTVGKNRIVLDVSCKKHDGKYYVSTDRWQKISDTEFNRELLCKLSGSCDEFLVHAIDSEGKNAGIDKEIISVLKESPIPVTYAGGISDYSDIYKIKETGGGRIDITIGSSLDIFGGRLDFSEVIRCTL